MHHKINATFGMLLVTRGSKMRSRLNYELKHRQNTSSRLRGKGFVANTVKSLIQQHDNPVTEYALGYIPSFAHLSPNDQELQFVEASVGIWT